MPSVSWQHGFPSAFRMQADMKLTVSCAQEQGQHCLSMVQTRVAGSYWVALQRLTSVGCLQETKTKFLGQPIYVSIREVSRPDRKITLNMVEATQRLAYRNLKVRALTLPCFSTAQALFLPLLGCFYLTHLSAWMLKYWL